MLRPFLREEHDLNLITWTFLRLPQEVSLMSRELYTDIGPSPSAQSNHSGKCKCRTPLCWWIWQDCFPELLIHVVILQRFLRLDIRAGIRRRILSLELEFTEKTNSAEIATKNLQNWCPFQVQILSWKIVLGALCFVKHSWLEFIEERIENVMPVYISFSG